MILVAQGGLIRFVNGKSSDFLGYRPEELTDKPFSDYIHPEDRKMVLERHLKRLKGETLPGVYPFRVVHRTGDERWVEVNAVMIQWEGKPATINLLSDITGRKQAEAEQEKLRDQLTQARKMESVGRLAGGVAHDFNNMLGVILGHTELALEQIPPTHPLHTDLKEIQKAAQQSADLTKQLPTFARKQIISPQVLDLNRIIKNMITMLQRLIGEDIDLIWKPAGNLWSVKMDPSQIDQILVNLCVNARDAIAGVGKPAIETGMKTFDR